MTVIRMQKACRLLAHVQENHVQIECIYITMHIELEAFVRDFMSLLQMSCSTACARVLPYGFCNEGVLCHHCDNKVLSGV